MSGVEDLKRLGSVRLGKGDLKRVGSVRLGKGFSDRLSDVLKDVADGEGERLVDVLHCRHLLGAGEPALHVIDEGLFNFPGGDAGSDRCSWAHC
jgi:hypothetical protein